MEIKFSKEFKKDYNKIKDKNLKNKLIKQISKLENNPTLGKPPKHSLKNHRSLRVSPFRIIYRIEEDKIIINLFEHRDEVYEKLK